jgi:hypothetical protein
LQGGDFAVLDQTGADIRAAEVHANQQGFFRCAHNPLLQIFTPQVKLLDIYGASKKSKIGQNI